VIDKRKEVDYCERKVERIKEKIKRRMEERLTLHRVL